MTINRRDFLKLAIGATIGAAIAITEPTERSEVRSPSRETAELGKAMTLGFQRGSMMMLDNIGVSVKAVKDKSEWVNTIMMAYDENYKA